MPTEEEKTLQVLGVGLKQAIKTELDSIAEVVQAKNNVEAFKTAITALGGDWNKLQAEAKTPRRTKAQTAAAEEAAANHPDAVETTSAPASEAGGTPAAETTKEQAPAPETTGTEIDPNEEERKVLIAEVRAMCTEYTKVGGAKEDIKTVLASKNLEKISDMTNAQLKGFQKKIKSMIDEKKSAPPEEEEFE